MNNYQPRAPHPERTAVEPCHTTVHATSCNTQSTPGEGVRIEELTELSHHSLIQYRLPDTSERSELVSGVADQRVQDRRRTAAGHLARTCRRAVDHRRPDPWPPGPRTPD